VLSSATQLPFVTPQGSSSSGRAPYTVLHGCQTWTAGIRLPIAGFNRYSASVMPDHLDGWEGVEAGHGVEVVPLCVLRHAAVAWIPIGQREDQPHAILARLVDHPVQPLPAQDIRSIVGTLLHLS